MSNEWVPFYRSLTKGVKKDLSRATRFIYMELSLESRSTGGVLRLPARPKTDAEAVRETIGGSLKEIETALSDLSVPLPGEDEPMIRVESDGRSRTLVIVAHANWVTPDSSTERVRKHRKSKRDKARSESPEETSGNELKRVTSLHVTPLEERRGEERRGDQGIPPVPVPVPVPVSETRLPDESPPPERPSEVRRVTNAASDGCYGDAVSAWAEGIRAATENPSFLPPRGGSTELARLVDAITTCCPDASMRLDWARTKATEFALSSPSKISVFAFVDWLNTPRKGGPVRGRAPVQSEPVTGAEWEEAKGGRLR